MEPFKILVAEDDRNIRSGLVDALELEGYVMEEAADGTGALRTFAEAYGLTCYAAFPGCATQTEPSAATVAFLTEKVEREGISTVFYIEFSNHLVADSIAEAARVQAESPVVDRWNEYMKDVMLMEMDPETGAQPLMKQVFFFD